MAGKIIADIIEAPYNKVSLNVGNVTVASINASGVYSNTGNLLITNTGSIGSAAIAANAITQTAIASGVAGTGPAFRAVRTTNQSSNHNTFTKVQLNTETFDTDNCFDNATNYRFTPNVAGYYQVNYFVSVQTLSTTAQVVLSAIYKNGSIYNVNDAPITQTSSATGWGALTSGTSDIVYLNGSTDYIELFSYFFDYTSTTSKNINQAQFSAALVRAA